MSEVLLSGLASNIENEDRALAYLEVHHNDNTYNWQIFIPNYVQDLPQYLDSVKQSILDDINTKEAQWTSLEPKTRTISDPMMPDETIVVDISKDEIVKPSIPDYYALRRSEYPKLSDQLDAVWKGQDSQAFIDMKNKILEVKNKYPKS
jgi:hypothetical protein